MKYTLLISLLFLSSCGGHQIQVESEETLPDDYLPIVLKLADEKLEGGSEFLEGFVFSMDLSSLVLGDELELETLISGIGEKGATGTLAYPTGKNTPIEYVIVRHRGAEEIYMKSSLGYFLWEMVEVRENEIYFAIYWWYCPPAIQADLDTLEMARDLLQIESRWNRNDDRECEDDIENNTYSLFCALKHASTIKMGEYNHHGTAMQQVRFAIDGLVPDHGFEHTLMDYNNAESTSHADILKTLQIAYKKIENEIEQK